VRGLGRSSARPPRGRRAENLSGPPAEFTFTASVYARSSTLTHTFRFMYGAEGTHVSRGSGAAGRRERERLPDGHHDPRRSTAHPRHVCPLTFKADMWNHSKFKTILRLFPSMKFNMPTGQLKVVNIWKNRFIFKHLLIF